MQDTDRKCHLESRQGLPCASLGDPQMNDPHPRGVAGTAVET